MSDIKSRAASREKRFTPGPWEVKKYGQFSGITAEHHQSWFVAEEVLERDATLIAAAPELLEALEMIMDDGPASLLDYDAAMKKAQAAIKKAYGETP